MTSLIIITITAIVVLYLGLYKAKSALVPVSLLGLAGAAGMLCCEWNTNTAYFNNMVLFDNYAIAFALLLILATGLIILSSAEYFESISKSNRAEFCAMLLFALTGGLIMVSFQNMAMLFIGIEILSVSMYVMAGIRKYNSASNEAALKYFLMGAFATGILLFGIALIYGATGSFDLNTIAAAPNEFPLLFEAGMIFLLIALAFKVGTAPFHFWTPDVYQGSPAMVTSFMSTVVKVAGFSAFLRLFHTAFPIMPPAVLMTMAGMIALTLVIGNVSAAYQQNAKRMLAYSSISHAGYMLIGIMALGGYSASAVLTYSIAYTFASIASFGVLILVKQESGSTDISAFNGLGRRHPVLAVIMTIAMGSLAGIPLTAGFIGKFIIFGQAIAMGYTWLTVVAVLMAAVGVYYYFKIIIAMYFREPTIEGNTGKMALSGAYRFVLVFCAVLTIVLGLIPSLMTDVLSVAN